ncbi:MAG TPA: AAA family ATPase [Succinivibrionaceae bacterium]|nr:AAA family ATPase [Succinivibrionaceae bacterium]
MKKKNIINLIKYHVDNNDAGFRQEAYEIAREFDLAGDYQLSEYVMSLLSDVNSFVPQEVKVESEYFDKLDKKGDMLFLPDSITQELIGIVNAIERKIGIGKFLFQGPPGTGKTEAVKQLARILNRDIYMVNFASIVDSKLGQTQKNLLECFKEINGFVQYDQCIFLFDELDALALDRTSNNDHREMGRVTSSFLKCLDSVNENAVIIATTNLYKYLDKALVRRFDSVLDFDNYTPDDLLEISEKILDKYLQSMDLASRNIRLFRKIMKLNKEKLYPGELKNIIKTSIAFSDLNDDNDYLRRLYYTFCGRRPENIRELSEQKFTVRGIEVLTKKSKSSVSRDLQEKFS